MIQNKNPRGKDCIFYVLCGTRICVHDCECNFSTDKGGMQKWKEPKKTKSVRFPQGAVYLEKRGEERGTL